MQKSGKVSNVKTRKKIKFGEIFFRFLVLKVDSSHTNNFYGLQVEDQQKICSSGKSFFELQSNQRKRERKKGEPMMISFQTLFAQG
jgi:hypothetical protein